MQYTLVSGTTDDLDELVTKGLREGWKLVGGPVIVVVPPGCVSGTTGDQPRPIMENDSEDHELWAYQAMTHEDDDAVPPDH